MNTKLEFAEIEENYSKLSRNQQQSIKGGTGTQVNEPYLTPAQLQLLFDYSNLDTSGQHNAQTGFNSAAGKVFSLFVENMYATPIGKALLDQLYTTDVNNVNTGKPHTSITLIDSNPPTGGGSAQYNNDTNHTLYLGNITASVHDIISSPTMNQFGVGGGMSSLSHELFHAFEQIVKNNVQSIHGGEITGELQAYMFSEMVSYQFNAKMGTALGGYVTTPDAQGNQIGQWNFIDMENLQQNTYNGQQNTFLPLFNAMLNSYGTNANHFDMATYNQLITAFAATPLGKNYSGMKSDTVTSTAQQDIFALYNSAYKSVDVQTIPNGVIQWYNPTTGIFLDTPLGVNEYVNKTDGYTVVIKSTDADVTAAINSAQNNGTLNLMFGSVRVEGQAAAALAASLAKSQGFNTTQIQQAATMAINATINVNTPNSGHTSGGGNPANGINVPVTSSNGTVQYITIYPDSDPGSSSQGNQDGHIDAATGMWFPDTTVVQGGADGSVIYIDSPINTGGSGGGGGWGGGGSYYA